MFESIAWHRVLNTNEVPDTSAFDTVWELLRTPVWLSALSLSASIILFAIAVHFEWNANLTPRAANRPKKVLKNAILHGMPEKYKDKIYIYPFAWIQWAYNLTYKKCLLGIPGTGTRKDGWEGPLLKTNLDAVVMLKFHTLLFKISLLVAALCILLIPINYTATCNPEVFGVGTCALHQNMSYGFYKTTFSNIPNKIYNDDINVTVGDLTINVGSIFASITNANTTSSVNGTDSEEENTVQSLASDLWVSGNQTLRVWATMICCLFIYAYTLYLVTLEWAENVALRRAFFLEASHYGQRMIELNKFDLDFVKKKKKNDDVVSRRETESRPLYLTHPEIRETPPSVGLYSVLYQLPNHMVTYDTAGATSLERQLVAASKFFDEVVPPQPGFSSSVAAVTMIPDARLVAKAWGKWKVVERKLQTLRYARNLIAKESENKRSSFFGKKEVASDLQKSFPDKERPTEESKIGEKDGVGADEEEGLQIKLSCGSDGVTEAYRIDSDGNMKISRSAIANDTEPSPEGTKSSENDVFKYDDFDVKLYAKSIGFGDEVDLVSDFVDGMGIEEFTVFAYNCALMEGGPGFGKKVLNYYSVESLKEEEEQILKELDDAHQELIDARAAVVAQDDDVAVSTDNERNDSGLSQEILRQGSIERNVDDEIHDWKFSENEMNETLQILESNREKQKKGKFSCISDFYKRVFHGPDILELEPKYFGLNPDNKGKAFLTSVDRPSYAVVTFTSRHAAVIARQCLADGMPTNHWEQVDDIPIYPLAEAPQNMYLFPRGYMRPVTPTITYASKKFRRWLVIVFYIAFTFSFTIIMNSINQVLWNPDLIGKFNLSTTVIPTLSGATQSLVFSACPQVFKFIANKEGLATNTAVAEQRAMMYFWYFYLFARYLGQFVLETFNKFTSGGLIEELVISAVSELAATIPTILGPSALTYIIFATSLTWPLMYFLQTPNFLVSMAGLRFINRVMKGGGPGAEASFRIYVNSGYVFACLTVLAPLCPLIGPFGFLYFVVQSPMLRWLMVFSYRPKFDGGGDKWPKLHHMIITSLVLSQLLVSVSFLLKGNYYEGVIIILCIIPTLLYNGIIKERFLRPYQDASLRDTSRMYNAHQEKQKGLDEWQKREEFRRWLVDCHKASYLPTCLSGGNKNLLTAEPAMVVAKPIPNDSAKNIPEMDGDKNLRGLFRRQSAQKGGIMRRQRFGI